MSAEFVPPEERDPDRAAEVVLRLEDARRVFARAAHRYRLASVEREQAVKSARRAGLSHDEIAGLLGVTRAVAVRLDQR